MEQCKICKEQFQCEVSDDNSGTGLCYYCFEDALEAYEDHKREKLARANEY